MIKPLVGLSRMAPLIAIVSVLVFVNPRGLRPSHAAPSSLASFMPQDTFSFTEFDTSNLPQMFTDAQALLTSLGVQVTITTNLDQSLTQALGRPGSLEQDIFPWLGDRVGVGVYVPKSLIEAAFTHAPIPSGPLPVEIYVVASVKEESAADAFLTNALSAQVQLGEPLTARQSTLSGVLVTIYSDQQGNSLLARWPGYVAVGNISLLRVLDVLGGKAASLAKNANYQKIVGMLKPNNLAMSYLNSPFPPLVGLLPWLSPVFGDTAAQILNLLGMPVANLAAPSSPSTATSPANVVLAQTFMGLGASGIGFYGDQHILATDWASYVNPRSLQNLLTLLKVPATVKLSPPAPAISLHMADYVPQNAVAVAIGSNPAQIARNGLAIGQAGTALADVLSGTTSTATSFALGYAQIQAGLKVGFKLDLNADVLSWLNGEFAVYTLVDTSQPSVISFTPVLLVQTTSTAKADNFITRINTGLQDLLQLSPAKNSNGLYTLALPAGNIATYGRVSRTVLLSFGDDSAAAFSAVTSGGSNGGNGQGLLSSDPAWQAAAALAPKTFQNFWYVNLTSANALVKELIGPTPPAEYILAAGVLSLFKTAVLFSTDLGGGSSLTTIVLERNSS